MTRSNNEPIDISIVICTYNRAASLSKSLQSIAALAIPEDTSVELLVVDNASTDATRATIEAAPDLPQCHYLYEAQQGKSHALNLALSKARGELLVMTDDDVLLERDCLRHFWQAWQQHKDHIDWFGGRVIANWNVTPKPDWISETIQSVLEGSLGIHDLGKQGRDYGADDKYPIGALMALSRRLVDKVGQFRTDLGPSGKMRGTSEDTEYLIQSCEHGFKGRYVGEASALHYVDPSRLSLRGFYRYGYAKGLNARRWNPDKTGSFSPRVVARQATGGLLQVLKGRSDTLRVCILNIGYEFGKLRADNTR